MSNIISTWWDFRLRTI